MTTISAQLTRIRDILQDTATTDDLLIQAHQESLQTLARHGSFPQIQWINAIANQALYTLPTIAVTVQEVLYNERVLRYVTERALDRYTHGWEDTQDRDPTFWTWDNQNPNTIRLIPAPVRTGSLIPVIPSPLFQDMRDNIVVFLREDISTQVDTLSDDPIPTMLDEDDVLVWMTAQHVAMRETDTQNLPVAQACAQLAALWHQLEGE